MEMTSATPKTVKYKFNWILNNATRENIQKHENDLVKTHIFQTKLDDYLIEWYLYANYYEIENLSYLAIYFEKINDGKCWMKLHVNEKIFEKVLCGKNTFHGWKYIGLEKLLDPTNKFIDNEECLKLAIEINFTEVLKVDNRVKVVTPDEILYSQFFNNEKYSDFKFKFSSDDVELPVHRIVLDAYSPVFSKMFSTEMEEKKSNVVTFEDISSETMKSALEFIYTGKYIFNDVESTIKILYVSEKYEIKELKKLCIDELMTKVNEENVLEIFETSDLYNDPYLEEKCLSIIIEKFPKLKDTQKFRKLSRTLITKIFDEFARLFMVSKECTTESSF